MVRTKKLGIGWGPGGVVLSLVFASVFGVTSQAEVVPCGTSIAGNLSPGASVHHRISNVGDCVARIEIFDGPDQSGNLLYEASLAPGESIELDRPRWNARSFRVTSEGSGEAAVLRRNPLVRNDSPHAAYWFRADPDLHNANPGAVLVGHPRTDERIYLNAFTGAPNNGVALGFQRVYDGGISTCSNLLFHWRHTTMNGSVVIDAGGADPPTLEVSGWAPSDDDPCIRARNYDGRKLFVVTYGGSVGIGRNDPSHPLHLASGAHCTAGGVWTDASSRKYKEGIRDLGEEEALAALAGLSPRRFRYRAEKEEEYTGFIAEEVPDLVATRGRDGLSAMEIAAVLTKVVQAQQRRIEEMEARMEALEEALRSASRPTSRP